MNLLQDEYYSKAVSALIQRAQRNIFIISFLFRYPVMYKPTALIALYEDLLAAQKRGVDCRIIMNYTLPENSISHENKSTATWLSSNGIECRFLPRQRCVHAKMLVIDGITAVLGSHNWTDRAQTRNLELSVSLDQPDVVIKARNLFVELWSSAVRMP